MAATEWNEMFVTNSCSPAKFMYAWFSSSEPADGPMYVSPHGSDVAPT